MTTRAQEMHVTEQATTHREVLVGHRNDFDDDGRRFVTVDGCEIGVLRHDDQFYAYENRCVHQGGPVCEGRILGRVEAILGEDKTMLGERFSTTETHLICPWHGYEYDLKTGECAVDRRLRLRRFDVIQKGDDIYVLV
jgi:nitrite reductase/ring-hydroxylating ferredoxin subunit